MKNVTDLTGEENEETATLVVAGKDSPPLPPPVDNQGVFSLGHDCSIQIWLPRIYYLLFG